MIDEMELLHTLRVPADSHVVASFIVGSHAHGTNIAPDLPFGTDDTDIMTIVVPPPHLCLGIDCWEHLQSWVGDNDVVVYSLRKLLGLMAKSNPNVLMLLNMPPDCVRVSSDLWRDVVDAREAFLSKDAWGSFAGYANSQLAKMEGSAFKGYMGEKRKAIVKEVGFDTKNAAHLIRLLRMCCDLFETGQLVVRRPDADDLRAIKTGRRSLDSVREEAADLFARSKDAMKRSGLPEHVDREHIGRLCSRLHLKLWGAA